MAQGEKPPTYDWRRRYFVQQGRTPGGHLDGATSEVATRRSEFAATLKAEGIGGLIAALKPKASLLTATMAGLT